MDASAGDRLSTGLPDGRGEDLISIATGEGWGGVGKDFVIIGHGLGVGGKRQ